MDNRSLRSVRQGLGYRSMKDVNMKIAEHEPWGTIVTGIAEDDGWLKAGSPSPVVTLPPSIEEESTT